METIPMGIGPECLPKVLQDVRRTVPRLIPLRYRHSILLSGPIHHPSDVQGTEYFARFHGAGPEQKITRRFRACKSHTAPDERIHISYLRHPSPEFQEMGTDSNLHAGHEEGERYIIIYFVVHTESGSTKRLIGFEFNHVA